MSAPVRVASWLTAAVFMAAAMWLHARKPHLDAGLQNPISTTGRAGTVVGNRVFSVAVDRVDVASAIVDDGLTTRKTMLSPGVFVIVYLRIRSNQKPFTPGHVRLAARGGLSYDESGRTAISDTSGTYEPMLWGNASYVFEIPKDRLAGARLIVGESAPLDQLSAQADVNLGIDGRKAAELIAHAPRDYVIKKA
ncbi:hypothetical protein NE236_43110 [Actinoallomurus purpureus]|uniref:hypothetical protein n=1 Tax=Actinoallomurus purpureus TaxID=478114 RepID=UPI0020936F3C|nr:hypothetical protein [Actinoallomurus purpureus]MCO6011758.1 hypothetical protein [Actinoallomurus purpureus]